MRRRQKVTLARSRRAWVFAVFGGLFATGLIWLAVRPADDGLAEGSGRLAAAMLRLHGAAAMVALVLLGVLWVEHLRPAWRAGRNRRSGGALAGACVLLAVSGYGLYYAGGETLRLWISRGHGWLGVALPAVIALHVWRGRKSRAQPPVTPGR